MSYLSRDRAAHPNSPDTSYGLSASSRARKVATIRSFYKYLTNKAKLLTENPMQDLDSPRLKKSLPRYLDLEESVELLESVDGADELDVHIIDGDRFHGRILEDEPFFQLEIAEKAAQIQKVFVHGFWGVALDGLMIDQKIPKDGW